ncbi:MAG TPA: hypothetical protein PLW44_10430 [Chitinophagales bacterium]|nr:hypothetical protein [Chitinophagales bacterium]
MTPSNIEKYKQKLFPLTNTDFEKELLSASLDNLLDKRNKLRFNNFACGVRELSRHILHNLSPDKEVMNCVWYKNESKKPGQPTRAERVKYAIQKGLPDKFVETIYDTDEHVYDLKEALDTLNKYTHVNPDTFNISESEINKLTKEVLETFKRFAFGIDNFHKLFKIELEEHIDKVVMEHTIEETFDDIDILATHHNIEEHETTSYTITHIDSKDIFIEASGILSVRLQYGSDGDLAKGDGVEMNTSFPFDCHLQIIINEDFSKSEYKALTFNVNTDDWYE